MPEKLIDEVTDRGKVYSGPTFVADVQFTLRTYERYVPTKTKSSGGHPVALRRHSLEILKTSRPLPMMGGKLTLHIGDGGNK